MHKASVGWNYSSLPEQNKIYLARRIGSEQIPLLEWKEMLKLNRREILKIAMQAGSFFDRKDLTLHERELEVADLIEAYITRLLT